MPRVTGQELIDYIKSHPGESKTEIAWACGYYVEKGPDEVSYRYSDLQNAIIQAQGLDFGKAVSGQAHGRRSSGVLTVGKTNSAIVVGKSYVSAAGAEPGDQFTVTESSDGRIVLEKRPALAAVA